MKYRYRSCNNKPQYYPSYTGRIMMDLNSKGLDDKADKLLDLVFIKRWGNLLCLKS